MVKTTPSGKVIGEMPDDEARDTPVLIDIKAETGKAGILKVHLDVVFQSVALERPIGKGYWYLGCTGADIELQAKKAVIVRHSDDEKVEVKCKVKGGKDRKVDVKVKPSLKVGEDVEISIGEAGVEGGSSQEAETEYSSYECPLKSIARGDTVVWEEVLTQGQKIVREYLFTTLKLWAECQWSDTKRDGRVHVRNSTYFFSQQKRRLGSWKALLMEVTLALRGTELPNRNGIQVNYAITEP